MNIPGVRTSARIRRTLRFEETPSLEQHAVGPVAARGGTFTLGGPKPEGLDESGESIIFKARAAKGRALFC